MNKFHGIFSLIILAAAITMALISLFTFSWIFALVYIGVVILSFMGISFFYCTKCCCRINNCAHLFLGKLTLLMPERPEGKYNSFDIIGTFICVGLVLGFPQYWLWQAPVAAMVFWLVSGLAFLEILIFVCTACENRACVLNKNKTYISTRKNKL